MSAASTPTSDMRMEMDAMKRSLELRTDKTVPSDFLIKLIQLVLTYNVFEFGKTLQCLGTAMGNCCAPNYANIMMNDLNIKIRNLGKGIMTAEDLARQGTRSRGISGTN